MTTVPQVVHVYTLRTAEPLGRGPNDDDVVARQQ